MKGHSLRASALLLALLCLLPAHAPFAHAAMQPRRSTHDAEAAECATSALSPLPLSVVLHIFSLLPVDARLRCLEVCRGWRAVFSERSLWTRLDLSTSCGVERVPLGLLRAAAARAGGLLVALDVFDREFVEADEEASADALLEVVKANGATLRELRLGFADGARLPPLDEGGPDGAAGRCAASARAGQQRLL
jgi:hypothetical protein